MNRKPRLLLYSHDMYGLGHLRRTLAIAGQVAADLPKAHQLLITGSMVAGAFGLPPRLDMIKLPALSKRPSGQYTARARDTTWRRWSQRSSHCTPPHAIVAGTPLVVTPTATVEATATPDPAQMYLDGVTAYQAGDYARAEAQFRAALELWPRQANWRNSLGLALAQLDRYEAAIAEYERAMSLDPSLAEAQYNLGATHVALGNIAAAEAAYRAALSANPGFAAAHLGLGKLISTVMNAAVESRPGELLFPLRQPALELQLSLVTDPDESRLLNPLRPATPAPRPRTRRARRRLLSRAGQWSLRARRAQPKRPSRAARPNLRGRPSQHASTGPLTRQAKHRSHRTRRTLPTPLNRQRCGGKARCNPSARCGWWRALR
jgi:tetratricopeptide (TPR) repeat protein